MSASPHFTSYPASRLVQREKTHHANPPPGHFPSKHFVTSSTHPSPPLLIQILPESPTHQSHPTPHPRRSEEEQSKKSKKNSQSSGTSKVDEPSLGISHPYTPDCPSTFDPALLFAACAAYTFIPHEFLTIIVLAEIPFSHAKEKSAMAMLDLVECRMI